MPEFSPTPYQYANQWREARYNKDTAKVLRPPSGMCMLSGHTNDNFPEPQHQDRIYSPYRLSRRHRRSAGYIANIRYESQGDNSPKPASFQVVLKILWTHPSTGEEYFVFARTTSHASAFAPKIISHCSPAHIRLGDLVSGGS